MKKGRAFDLQDRLIVWLKVIRRAKMIKPDSKLAPLIKETDELFAILFTSVETAKKSKGR